MIMRSRGKLTSAKTRQVKMYGVPSGEKLEDYFSEASVHHKLISEGQVMVHANANIEYWTHADDNKKPVVDQLEWGKYYSTLVILGQAGPLKGKNHDTVRLFLYVM